MVKDTSKIVEELGLSPDFTTFYSENKDYMVKEDLSTLLDKLIKKYDLKKSQVIRAAETTILIGVTVIISAATNKTAMYFFTFFIYYSSFIVLWYSFKTFIFINYRLNFITS